MAKVVMIVYKWLKSGKRSSHKEKQHATGACLKEEVKIMNVPDHWLTECSQNLNPPSKLSCRSGWGIKELLSEQIYLTQWAHWTLSYLEMLMQMPHSMFLFLTVALKMHLEGRYTSELTSVFMGCWAGKWNSFFKCPFKPSLFTVLIHRSYWYWHAVSASWQN